MATKVDKVSGKDLSTNDYTTTEKSKLAAITGANTGDQDLSLYATTASVALKVNTTDISASLDTKVDKVIGKNLSTNDFTNTEKNKLAAIIGANTGDQDLSLLATSASVALKANTSDINTSLALKENQSNKSADALLGGTDANDILYPTQKAVKAYVAANTASGGIADGGITTIKLADLAVTDAKLATGISKSKVGLGNVENTAVSTWAGTSNITTVGTLTNLTVTNPIAGSVTGNAATVTTNANLTGVVTSIGNATSIANGAITNAMLLNNAVANLTGINSGDETEASIKSKLGVTNFFSGAYADLTGKPTLFSGNFNDLTNKPDALANSLTGTGTSGQLSFFNGTSTVTSSSDLFWDASNKRLGLRTSSPGYPLEINTGAANYGLMITSESSNLWGSGIGFKSSTDATTKTGLLQLDRDGALVIRTLQDNMYFDNVGTGSMKFRMGDPSTSNIGMTLNNSGNLEVTGTLKTGAVIYPKVVGNDGEVLTFDSQTNKAVWKMPSIANGSITNAMMSNPAVANLYGVNSGDDAINSRYNWLVTNAAHYGDIKAMITGSDGYYVIGINGTRLLDLQTGILKNTTGTGVPSIAVASDFPTLNQSTTGNSATTTKLATSRNINGVAFDGTGDITIAVNAGTLTGTSLNSTVVSSSLTSVGTLSNLTVTNTINGSVNGNAASATKLATTRNINGVAFDGTTNITITADAGTLTGTSLKSTVTSSSLTSVGTLANLTVTNPISGSITGNAASATLASSATKLATSRKINGIAFDGTGDITVAASAATLTGTTLNATVTGSSLTSIGILNNATVNGKVIVGAAAEASSSAILEASSTTQGFLPPRMTIAQRLAIVSPSQGLMIYCTNCGSYGEPQYYNGNAWMNFSGNASSKSTPTINITVGTYTFTASTPQGPNSATNSGTGSTYAYTYVGTGSTTYASSATRPTNAGTYSVTASLSASGDGNYNTATASAAFTIAQAIPTVTPTIGTYAYSGVEQGPSAATNTGTGNTYTYSYSGTGITTYGPIATKPIDGGTYTVIATVAANGNYAASSSSATAFRISLNDLAVGNTYGGGKVAYILKAGDIGYDASQKHGLIVSGYLTTNAIVWGNKLELTGASGGAGIYNQDYGTWDYPPADLETGMTNTNLIINSEGAGTNYPAAIARAYTVGGYTNWYLPSASQMNAMKTNLSPSGVNFVWTSTELSYGEAFIWNIINGGYQYQEKNAAFAKFLAARSF